MILCGMVELCRIILGVVVDFGEIKNAIVYKEMNVIASQNKKCCNATIKESEARL